MTSDSGERAAGGGLGLRARPEMIEALDNPVWHALRALGPAMAVKTPRAARFVPAIAPFFAIDRAHAAAYVELRALIAGAAEARLFRPEREPVPQGWRETFAKPILQMVLPTAASLPSEAGEVVTLCDSDVPDMLALARRANPGPFAARTHELGRYIGIREEGRLIAMGGERFSLNGHVEISAVATDPDHRGRGHGRRLTITLARGIRAAGAVPFLHVFPNNAATVALYRSLGFVERRVLIVVWLAPREES